MELINRVGTDGDREEFISCVQLMEVICYDQGNKTRKKTAMNQHLLLWRTSQEDSVRKELHHKLLVMITTKEYISKYILIAGWG